MIRTIFDSRYLEYFNRATKDVPLLYALYFLCISLVKLLRAIGASPTQTTRLSNVFAFAAVCSLIRASNPWWFPLLWVADAVGCTGRLRFDPSCPDGTPRKLLDCRLLNDLGWKPATPLIDGIVLASQDYLAGIRSAA